MDSGTSGMGESAGLLCDSERRIRDSTRSRGVCTVARRRLIDEHRRRNATDARIIPLDETRLEHRQPDDYGIDVARTLAAGVASLPAEQREVVVLKVIEGRRFAEIAVCLGVSEEACRTRLSRALRSLRARLEEEGITP
jgi:RNA polymerase sigma-70 factor (ECF subfamily)